MRSIRGLCFAAAAPLLPMMTASAQSSSSARPPIPDLTAMLGFAPGADQHLPGWKQITDYFTALDKASPRVSVRTIGKTVLGRPFIVAFISDSATLANLEHYRQIQRKLMDPRLQAPGERQKLIDEGKNVILVTSAIHSTESGGFTTPLRLRRLYRRSGSRAVLPSRSPTRQSRPLSYPIRRVVILSFPAGCSAGQG
jgi:hypothetical protein